MNKVKLHSLACMLFEDYDAVGLSRTDNKEYINLGFFEKVYVDRIVNNLIRQDFY